MTLVNDCVAAVRSVVGSTPVGLHDPLISGDEERYVRDCLSSGQVSSIGAFVGIFESRLAQVCGVSHAVATVNGTAALHIAFRAIGVVPGDEVILPPLSFVALANAVAYCGANPVFVDIEGESLGMDPESLRAWLSTNARESGDAVVNRKSGRPIRAVAAVHVFGHPCKISEISEISAEFGLPLVEDAAEALGSVYEDRPAGSFGDIAAVSFNGNKIVTSGGGGAILCSDATLAEKMRHLTTTAKVPHPWRYFHDQVGYNYRMPNINAAVGLGQIGHLDSFIQSKRRLWQAYTDAFAALHGVRILSQPKNAVSNFWLQNLVLDSANINLRNSLIAEFIEAGYGCRPAWDLLCDLPAFAGSPRGDLRVAGDMVRRIVSLPSGAGLA